MPGFAALIAKDEPTDVFSFPLRALSPLVCTKKTSSTYTVCHYVTPKFERDKICQEDDELLVALEGVVLNSRALQARYAASDLFRAIKQMYAAGGDEFFKDFRGDFSGLLYDKRHEKLLLFTNHTGTKMVFYYVREDGLAFSTDLVVLSDLLRARGWQYTLDEDGAYFLLTYGFMLEDYTLLKEVRRLRPGQYLKYTGGRASVHTYYTLRNDVENADSPDEALDRMAELLRRAVAAEYDKDLEYGYRHLAHMTGGMDAKLSTCLARELGYQRIVNLTFSQTGAPEEKIARKVAADLGNEYLFYALDNGDFLTTSLEDEVLANGGLVMYTGAAHELSAYRCVNFEPFGGVHSGEVGSAYFVWAALPGTHMPEPTTYLESPLLLDRVVSLVRRLQAKYQSSEIYKYMNRACNCSINGEWIANQFSEPMSPFTHVDFLEYVLSVPVKYRIRRDFEDRWFLREYPRVARYRRAATGFSIGTSQILVQGRRYARALRKRLFGEWRTHSMNPFQYWWRTNPRLQAYFQDYFDRHIGELEGHRELQNDCRRMFQTLGVLQKGQVLTLLAAHKRYFPQ